MNSDLQERLKQLNIEDFIWVIYIFIILMSWYSNYIERKYFLYRSEEDKEKYRSIIIVIFTILVVVYLYFLKSSFDDIRKLKQSDSEKKKELVYASFIASLLIFISGIIFLYIAIVDDDLNVELAFN